MAHGLRDPAVSLGNGKDYGGQMPPIEVETELVRPCFNECGLQAIQISKARHWRKCIDPLTKGNSHARLSNSFLPPDMWPN